MYFYGVKWNKAPKSLKGRGAQDNPANRFHQHNTSFSLEEILEEEAGMEVKTQLIPVAAKSIVNKVDSPDIPFSWSLNPYQGCEHGCVYCYARPTHNYWGYSSGLDFETKILYKPDAPALLSNLLASRKWSACPISLSGNTDPYQPAERQLKLTRQLLEIFLRYRHPVSIITKSALILRDLDLLEALASMNLLTVAISVTTNDDALRRFLEPRTSSVPNRWKAVQVLSAHQIPVFVMLAPIIPGLNDSEIMPLAKNASANGALGIGHTIVRLNWDNDQLFQQWLAIHLPDRAAKVMHRIAQCHGGQVADYSFETRMRGKGPVAAIIYQQMQLAKKKYFTGKVFPPYNLDLHEHYKSAQLSLFQK